MIPQKGHKALRHGRVSLEGHYYFLTFVTRNRSPYFSEFQYGCAVSRILNSQKNTMNLKRSKKKY